VNVLGTARQARRGGTVRGKERHVLARRDKAGEESLGEAWSGEARQGRLGGATTGMAGLGEVWRDKAGN